MILKIKLGIIGGTILTIIGIILKFTTDAQAAINLFTLQPVISDGSIILVLGLCSLVGSSIAYFRKEKEIEDKISEIKKEQKEKQNQPNWLKYK